MKTASLKELKISLENATHDELLQYCLHFIKYKKENKELLTYLIYESNDKFHYIQQLKGLIDSLFVTMNLSNLYFVKKTIRKIIRTANKYIKFSNDAIVEIDILIVLAEKMKSLNLPLHQNKTIFNMYTSLIKKINATLNTLHEDEQYDYLAKIKQLSND